MNQTPELPDFSAVPPSEGPAGSAAPGSGPAEEVAHQPARSGRAIGWAAFATSLIVGAVGVTAFAADRRPATDDVQLSSARAGGSALPGDGGQSGTQGQGAQGQGPAGGPAAGDPDGDRDGPGRHGGPGGLRGLGGPGGWRDALHGELVVPQADGTGTRTVVVQSGKVTAVSARSLSVKSTDGYTATYAITSGTRVMAGSTGIGSVKVADTVEVAATKSGSTLTALVVGDRDRLQGMRGQWRGPGRAPTSPATPSPTTSGASSTA